MMLYIGAREASLSDNLRDYPSLTMCLRLIQRLYLDSLPRHLLWLASLLPLFGGERRMSIERPWKEAILCLWEGGYIV